MRQPSHAQGSFEFGRISRFQYILTSDAQPNSNVPKERASYILRVLNKPLVPCDPLSPPSPWILPTTTYFANHQQRAFADALKSILGLSNTQEHPS